MEELIRKKQKNKIKIIKNNEIFNLNEDEFFKKNNIRGIIRINKEDYNSLKPYTKYLTHFNLQFCTHKKGEIYALPSIVKKGYFTSKEEVLPLLSFENCLTAECIDVKNNIKYKDLTKKDFEHSFKHIKNIKDLKSEIIKRYSISLPHITPNKLISLGVSITKLKIKHPIKHYLFF